MKKNYCLLIILLCFTLTLSTFTPLLASEADSHYDKGYEYLNSGYYDEAIEEFLTAMYMDPSYSFSCNFNIGVCYEYKELYSQALDYFVEAAAFTDNYEYLASTYLEIGYCHSQIGNIDKALENLNISIDYEPLPGAYSWLGACYEYNGDIDMAIKSYKEYLKLAPPDDPGREELENYIAELEQGVNMSQGSGSLQDYIDLGYDYYYQGAYEDAIATAQKILSINSDTPEGHDILGLCYKDQGESEKALQEFNRVIKLAPDFFGAHLDAGLICMDKGDYNSAINYLNNYKNYIDNDYDRAYYGDYNLGLCYFDLGDYAKAITYFDNVITFEPNDSLSHYNLGAAYYNTGNYEKAKVHYEKYLALDPDGYDAENAKAAIAALDELIASGSVSMSADDYYNLGNDYYEQGNYEEAEKAYIRALEIDPDHLYAHNDLGVIYYDYYKDYSRAAYHFLATLEIDPTYALGNYNVGLIYEIQERYAEAIEKYKYYLKLEPHGTYSEYCKNSITELEKLIDTGPGPTPEPTVLVASNTPPRIEIIEPASLIGSKNLVLEETNPQVTTIRLVGIASDDEEVVKITVNGQPVETGIPSAKGLEVIQSTATYKYQFATNVGLSTGENVIKVQAWDKSGNMGEAEVSLNYNPEINIANNNTSPVTTAAQKGEKWAVIIGIGKYQHPGINQLNYTVADAKAIYDFLTTKGGFKTENVKLLLDNEATTTNIKSALGTFLSRKAMENDTVFIYFSGHGAPEPDPSSTDGDGMSKYIVTYDSNPEELYATAFPMEEIKKIFQRIEAKKIVLFIDACYSGASGGRTFSKPGMKTGNVSDAFLDSVSEGEGRVVITASGTNEVSLEVPELGHGVFTYYLLEGLNGSADIDSDGMITIDETYEYLYDKVLETSKNYGGGQHPMKKGESSGKFVLIKL